MKTREELKILQNLPLSLKIEKTKLRITEFVDKIGLENCYISFSGGKDSTVLLDIARQIYPKIKAVFADTGLEYPEIREFARSFKNVEVVRPELKFKKVIQSYGYPIVSKEVSKIVYGCTFGESERSRTNYIKKLQGLNPDGTDSEYKKRFKKWSVLLDAPFMISNRCCWFTKEKPLNIPKIYPIIATMANESEQRLQGYLKTGCNIFQGGKKDIRSKPMSFWTEQDILHYIHKYKLPICKVYGEIIGECEEVDIQQILFEEFDPFGEKCEFENLNEKCNFQTTGCSRTGCVFCGFGAHLEKGESRFERLKKTHPNLYNYCINGGKFDPVDGLWKPNKHGLGMGFVFDWCNNNIKNFQIRY